MNFKEQMGRDIKNVFNNPGEFADMTVFYYNGKRFKCPVVLDYNPYIAPEKDMIPENRILTPEQAIAMVRAKGFIISEIAK